jgi:hypothetical protein
MAEGGGFVSVRMRSDGEPVDHGFGNHKVCAAPRVMPEMGLSSTLNSSHLGSRATITRVLNIPGLGRTRADVGAGQGMFAYPLPVEMSAGERESELYSTPISARESALER